MLYSAQISTYYDFKKRVFQLYYYTGDTAMTSESAAVESAVVIISKASIINKFLAIDAGDHDAESMLASGDFNFAVSRSVRMSCDWCYWLRFLSDFPPFFAQ